MCGRAECITAQGCGTAAAAAITTLSQRRSGLVRGESSGQPACLAGGVVPGLSAAVRAGRDSWDHVQLDARGDLVPICTLY